MIYAGIGSRSTPIEFIDKMIQLGRYFAQNRWLLRSGAAYGADSAFEHGCDIEGGLKEIWLPWRSFNGSKSQFVLPESGEQYERAMEIAASIHPAWHRCTLAAKRLHARNVFQVLGGDFETPVNRVICWHPTEKIGGTATAIKLASDRGIPVFNLAVRGINPRHVQTELAS